jgi:uridine monophosphate synthetase
MRTAWLSYTERSTYCSSCQAKRLLHLMDEKKTNLGLSADVTSSEALLNLAEQLGPSICMLKTHIDMIEDFTPQLTLELQALAKHFQFILFEDRKFADIGQTVKSQYAKGIYHIADWADIINAHSLPGPSIVKGLAEIGQEKNRGLVLIAEMSSAGHLMGPEYIKSTLKMAEQFPDFVIGFITQHAVSSDPRWINITPGIQFKTGGDELGQQYTLPEEAVLDRGSDVIIVGRGILNAADPVMEAHRYRECGWAAYQKRLKTISLSKN